MNKFFTCLLVLLLCTTTLTGCMAASGFQPLEELPSMEAEGPGSIGEIHMASVAESPLDFIRSSYCSAQATPVFDYFHHNRIQRFLAMWVEESTGIQMPIWNDGSFTRYQIVNHDLEVLRPDQELYYCTFSDGAGRYGYVVFQYYEAGPAIQKYDVKETTPYQYDLEANLYEIAEGLGRIEFDPATTGASRVSWYDSEKKRSDQVILLEDEKGNHAVCYFGEDALEFEKVNTQA